MDPRGSALALRLPSAFAALSLSRVSQRSLHQSVVCASSAHSLVAQAAAAQTARPAQQQLAAATAAAGSVQPPGRRRTAMQRTQRADCQPGTVHAWTVRRHKCIVRPPLRLVTHSSLAGRWLLHRSLVPWLAPRSALSCTGSNGSSGTVSLSAARCAGAAPSAVLEMLLCSNGLDDDGGQSSDGRGGGAEAEAGAAGIVRSATDARCASYRRATAALTATHSVLVSARLMIRSLWLLALNSLTSLRHLSAHSRSAPKLRWARFYGPV